MTHRFFVDESLLGAGKALATARDDVVYPGHPGLPAVHCGDLDEDWIPKVAALGLVAIVRDRKVFTRWWENDLIRAHRLRIVHLAVKRNLNNWGYLVILVRHWDAIDLHAKNSPDGPWRLRVLERTAEMEPVRAVPRTGPRPLRQNQRLSTATATTQALPVV